MITQPPPKPVMDYAVSPVPNVLPQEEFRLDGYRSPFLKWFPPLGIAVLMLSTGYYAYNAALTNTLLHVAPVQAVLLGLAVATVLLYEYFNGSHDAASTTVAIIRTRVLTPEQAGILFAVMNTLGAITNTAVATTIGRDIIGKAGLPLEALAGALIGGIGWSALTLRLGRPISSSHTLLSSLIGAAIAVHGTSCIQWDHVVGKIAIPMIVAIPLALTVSALLSLLFRVILARFKESSYHKSRLIQLGTSCLLAFAHGSNDGQKGMGMIALGLGAVGAMTGHNLPMWVLYSCAAAMGLGTLAGGCAVVTKLGKLFALDANPRDGANAQGTSAFIIFGATLSGIPLSTTQVTSMSNMGTSLGKLIEFCPGAFSASKGINPLSSLFGEAFIQHLSGLSRHVKDIVAAWVATIPFSMLAGGSITLIILLIKQCFH